MRIVSLLAVLVSVSVVCAQEDKGEAILRQMQSNIPATLAEAHAQLERLLPPEALAEIDAMPSEDGMIKYHFSWGLSIRNGWGLWAGGPLAKHMQELGFTHPDAMSGVILRTFWCKRHGKEFHLEEDAAAARRSTEIAQSIEEEKKSRVEESNTAVRNMMMGLRFEKRDVPVVSPPIQYGMSVRSMCLFRMGVFLTGYRNGRKLQGPIRMGGYERDQTTGEIRKRTDMDGSVARGFSLGTDGELLQMKPGDDFFVQGFHFDLTERKIRRICVGEVNDVYAAVVVGGRVWFAGMTDGKTALVGVGDQDRVTVPLPQEDEIPDLGMDGQSLLAVYSHTIYRLTNREWTLVYSTDILLPRSGMPAQRHGNRVFLREEGFNEENMRLWWLEMGEQPHLRLLSCDTGLFAPVVSPDGLVTHMIGPAWEKTSSYCVTSGGDLWACVGDGSYVLRRAKEGGYSIAVAGNSVEFTPFVPDARGGDKDLSISAVTALADDTLLLAGQTGLYRLKNNELTQELAFAKTHWTPNTILAVDDQSYVIGTTMRGGVYLLRKGDDGRWSFPPLDDTRDLVVW